MNPETCEKGQEQYEEYYSEMAHKYLIQYDYRTSEGKLFSTIAHSLQEARDRRNKWLLS